MITQGDNNDIEEENSRKWSLNDEKNGEKKPLLVLSYFDRIRGPSILYCRENFIHSELANILDVLETGTFIFTFRNYQTINYIFHLRSDFARGGIETLMITFMINNAEIENLFKYLKSKIPILKDLARKLKKFDELPKILHEETKLEDIFQLGTMQFQEEFTNIYDRAYEKLCPKLKKEIWRKIKVTCPICKTKKNLDIPERIVNQDTSLTSILIPELRVCDHAFIVFIDKKFKMHGSQKIDFKIKGLRLEDKLKPQDIDVFSVKMSLKPELLARALNAAIFKKKLLILITRDYELKYSIDSFFKYLFQDSFKIDISIQTRKGYEKNKDIYENHAILEKNGLREDAQYTNKQSKREREITGCFYNELDSLSSIINLRDKIRELYLLSNKICEYFKKKGEPEYLSRKNVIRDLENTYYTKIKKD